MIQSEHQGLLVLQSLVMSDFIFQDDIVLEGPFRKKLEENNQPDTGIRMFFFLTEDRKGIKTFLKRLGFKHKIELSIKTKDLHRSVEVLACGYYIITVAVVNNMMAAMSYVADYKKTIEKEQS